MSARILSMQTGSSQNLCLLHVIHEWVIHAHRTNSQGWKQYGGIAQSIKYLLYKHQDLSLISRTHVKEAWRVVCGCIPSTGEKRPSPQGSMARHSSPLNESQASERHWPFSKKKKGAITWEMMCIGVCWATRVCLYMYLCSWMCLDTRMHRHTPIQHYLVLTVFQFLSL